MPPPSDETLPSIRIETMDTYTPVLEAAVDSADVKAIMNGLLAYNAQHTGGDAPNYVVISLRNASGELRGGLVGGTYLGWLHVQALWVPDELRGRGHGRALLAKAEDEAIRRGCPRVFLETLSFQALDFYLKCGYAIVSTVPDFPPGGARYGLTKHLADDS